MLTIDCKETERLAKATKCAFCKSKASEQHVVMCASPEHGGAVLCERYQSGCPGIQYTIPICDDCFASYDEFSQLPERTEE